MHYTTNVKDWNVAFGFFINKFEKIYENHLNSVDVMVKSVIF